MSAVSQIAEIQAAIEAAQMQKRVAITDRDPVLFARREAELITLNERSEGEATRAVDAARMELARREKLLIEIQLRNEKRLGDIRASFENVEQRIENADRQIDGLRKALKDSSALAKLARLRAQIEAIEAALGDE